MKASGLFKERINIFSVTKVANTLGEMVKTNVLYKSVRSEVKYDGGKEAEKDGQLTPIQTITFNIRYNKEIKEDMIIEYRTKFYNIRYIEPIDKRITSILTTKTK